MTEICNRAYSRMLCQIEDCQDKNLSEQEQAALNYKFALQFWKQLKEEMIYYKFENNEEVIYFYKNIKPKFTALIEYLMLLNYGLSFVPEVSKYSEQTYWQDESKRLARFIKKNKSFVEYLKSGNTDRDEEYFLPIEAGSFHQITKVYDSDGEFVSLNDHLVASLKAEEMYHEFAKKKLIEARK